MAYQEEFYELNIVKLRRLFPVLHLWRIPGIAFEWRKLLFTFLLIHLMLNQVLRLDYNFESLNQGFVARDISTFSWQMLEQVFEKIFIFWKVVIFFDYTTSGNVRPVYSLSFIHNSLFFLWGLGGLYFIGITAPDFAKGKPGKFLEGYHTLKRAFPHFIFLMLTTLLITAILGGCINMAVYGVDHLSAVLFTPISIVLALIYIVLVWIYANSSIVLCSVVVDNSDLFDSLSRTYSYIVNRVGYTVLLIILSAIVCCISLWVFSLVIGILIIMLEGILNHGKAVDYAWLFSFNQLERVQAELLNLTTFTDFQHRALLPNHNNHDVYYGNMKMMVLAAGTSLFWTSSTVIYFLLRNAEDGTPLNEIYQPKVQAAETGVPLVGIAERERAMKQAAAATPPIKEEPLADTPL